MAKTFQRTSPTWWARVAAAGAVGGLAMALFMMIALAGLGQGFWTFLNAVAAVVPDFRTVTAAFDVEITLTGLVLHLATAAILALGYGALVVAGFARMGRRYDLAASLGFAYGLVLYFVGGLWLGPLADPALALMPQYHYVVAHILYGVVTALLVTAWTRRSEVEIIFAPTVRAQERKKMRQ